MSRNKEIYDEKVKKPFFKRWWFVVLLLVLVLVLIVSLANGNDNSSKLPVQDTPKQPTEEKQPATSKTEKDTESIASQYKVGEVGINGVVMTESLIQYLSEAEKNPIKSKDEAESITKEIYNDVTNQDGITMAEKEMMVKLYRAQIYYNENGNSEYSTVNGLLIEEFGGRINKTRGASGAAGRMNNIKTVYNSIKK